MPLMEKGEKQNSGIAIVVWFCLDRVTIPSQAEGLCPSKYHYLFLITFTTFLSLFDFCKLYTWTFHPLRKLRGRHNGTNGGMMCTQTFPKLMIYLDSPYKYSIHHHLQYCSPCLFYNISDDSPSVRPSVSATRGTQTSEPDLWLRRKNDGQTRHTRAKNKNSRQNFFPLSYS